MRLIILGKLIEKDLNEAIEMADKRNIVIMGRVEPDLHAKQLSGARLQWGCS